MAKEPAQEKLMDREQLKSELMKKFPYTLKGCESSERCAGMIADYILDNFVPKEQAKTEGLVDKGYEKPIMTLPHVWDEEQYGHYHKQDCGPTGRLVPSVKELEGIIANIALGDLSVSKEEKIAQTIHALISQPAPQPEKEQL